MYFCFGIDTCLKFCFLFAGRGMCVVILRGFNSASLWCAFVCVFLLLFVVCVLGVGCVEPFSFQCHVHLTGRPRYSFNRGSFSAYKVQVEMDLG